MAMCTITKNAQLKWNNSFAHSTLNTHTTWTIANVTMQSMVDSNKTFRVHDPYAAVANIITYKCDSQTLVFLEFKRAFSCTISMHILHQPLRSSFIWIMYVHEWTWIFRNQKYRRKTAAMDRVVVAIVQQASCVFRQVFA